MRSLILKFFNKKCKVDLDLLVEITYWGHKADCFYSYIVIDKGMVEIWISEKDNKFLVEFKDSDCLKKCKLEINNMLHKNGLLINEETENAMIEDIITKKEVLRDTLIDSDRKLIKFLNRG